MVGSFGSVAENCTVCGSKAWRPGWRQITASAGLVHAVWMPVSSLRLLGARVNDELITQQIVADLLVGADDTPYAFRIIS